MLGPFYIMRFSNGCRNQHYVAALQFSAPRSRFILLYHEQKTFNSPVLTSLMKERSEEVKEIMIAAIIYKQNRLEKFTFLMTN
jgi:hypothetical protein